MSLFRQGPGAAGGRWGIVRRDGRRTYFLRYDSGSSDRRFVCLVVGTRRAKGKADATGAKAVFTRPLPLPLRPASKAGKVLRGEH